jgi:hypothetical protein
MSTTPICPCDLFTFPKPIANAPGLTVIRYRLGDFLTFREALIRPRPEEVELVTWRPTAKGDLGLQMLEWWAYLADILTFYNERIANESYLRTAVLPESVKRMILILGYRPNPGIGATGMVAALLGAPGPITIPQGFPIQSKPGPGKQPQIFEVDVDTQVSRPDAVPGDPDPDLSIGSSVLLKGAVSGIKIGEQLLLLRRDETSGQALVTVQGVAQEKDPRGKTNTRIAFTSIPGLPAGERVTDYRLLRSTQTTGLWPYTSATASAVIQAGIANIAGISRQMARGTRVLFDFGSTQQQLVSVTGYSEIVWFANPTASPSSDPTKGPSDGGIPITHSQIGFTPVLTAIPLPATPVDIQRVVLHFAWNDVGQLIGSPATTALGPAFNLTPGAGTPFPSNLNNRPVLLEDANRNGSTANATGGGPSALALSAVSTSTPPFHPPLRVLFNLLRVSRGKTVPSEVLGNGDASTPAPEFALQKSPLTHLQTADPSYPDGFKSTLRIWVNGVEWQEARSFYGQAPTARVFVTREDENNQTHVQFGDGINGARLPTGAGNVVARYRYGSGADVPSPGQLTVITQPLPGLKSIVDPVAPGGGRDPDSPGRIRQLAPRSVLTFGRAVSGDDYEVIAAQAPGVARARAYWAFDAARQRTAVFVYVGDSAAAVTSARTALAGAVDPNRPVVVKQAAAFPVSLTLTLVVDPAYQAPKVADTILTALVDPDAGLFGTSNIKIGTSIFQSQIEDACLRVPGTLAVHSLGFFRKGSSLPDTGYRHFPGEGGFYQLQPADVTIATEVALYAR